MKKIVYIYNPSRAHKILPLLEEWQVFLLKNWQDMWKLLIKPNEITMVIVDSFGRWSILALITSIGLKVPLIVRLRGEVFREAHELVCTQPTLLKWLRYWSRIAIVKFCLWRANMLIFNSEYLAKKMASYSQGKSSAIVYNPYTEIKLSHDNSDTIYNLPKSNIHILTVTNMNLYSKIKPIIDVMDNWLTRFNLEKLDAFWIILGSGRYKTKLKEIIEKKELNDRIILLGWVENTACFYEWCDVLIHLTYLDAFPNVPMEAMMHSKPVITNIDSCGTREQVFNGVNGFVCKNAESFLEALTTYANNADKITEHGQSGKRLVVEKFSILRQKKEINVILKSLINNI